MIYWLSRTILLLFFKICFRYRARYTENLPKKGAFIIAGNHLSFLDPMAAGFTVKRRVCFLARESLFHNRLFSMWGHSVGAIPIKRGRFDLSAMKGSLERLRQGYVVAFFPEGTRSRDGSVKDPKGGVGFLAAKAGVPIVPVFIKGSDKALPSHAIFIRLKPIETRVGRPVSPEEFLDKDGNCDYQALSQEVMRRVHKLGED